MRVFISSVRRGLEDERDALPGIIGAIGHTPRRFEDYTAQPRPSREACIAGVNDCEIYLLLLGPHYGHEFDDTRQSPTHDEFTAAQTAGKPILVFRKNVEMDPKQVEFDQRVVNYTRGRFYTPFDTTPELQTKVVAAILELAAAPGPLTFASLAGPVMFSWRSDFAAARNGFGRHWVELELHVRGIGDVRTRSRREMLDLSQTLPGAARAGGLVPDTAAVEMNHDPDGDLTLSLAEPTPLVGGFRGAVPAAVTGVRLASDGQVSIWATLARDSLGPVIDTADAGAQLGAMLAAVGALNVINADAVAVGVGLSSTSMLALGKAADLPRTGSTSLGIGSDAPVHVNADESMSSSALGAGSGEAGALLARSLMAELTNRR